MRQVLIVAAGILTACSDGSDDLDRPPAPAPSSLTVFPTAEPEGAPGEMPRLVFTAALTQTQPEPVTISYQTRGLTATGGVDYLDTAGEATVPAGELETRITVELIGDAEEEPAETFELSLSASENAVLTSAATLGTLSNDDTPCDTPYVKRDPNRWRVNGGDPLNYAHRGGVIDFPENTLNAYSEAALAGVDVLEMDVYQTRDNHLVIMHDLDVDRTTDGSGFIADLTLAEIKRLDAAYWFVPGVGTPRDRPAEDYVFRGIATGEVPPPPGYRAEDFQVPTLEEALRRFPHELLNVELKPDTDGVGDYEQQIAAELRRFGRHDDVIAASFVDEAVDNFKRSAPCIHTSVPLGQGTALVLGALGDGTIPPVPEHVAFQVPPDTSQIGQVDIELEVVTEDFVEDARNANLAVQVWTINTCEEMLRMMSLGVDAIMTDRPLLLEQLLNTPPDERQCE